MIKILYIIFVSLVVANCSFKNVVKHHGVPFLEKKQETLIVNKANKNDIREILGNPSTTSKFDNDVWIYIERKKTNKGLLSLGNKKTFVNNVLVLEINSNGLLAKKDFFNMENMNDIKFSESSTEKTYSKRSFVYDFLSSMRQKINDPLGVREKKRKKINQQ